MYANSSSSFFVSSSSDLHENSRDFPFPPPTPRRDPIEKRWRGVGGGAGGGNLHTRGV